jgi:hypothetical protein
MKCNKTLAFLIFLFVIALSITGWCGKIIYPWNATTAIVKAGESFDVWLDTDEGQSVSSMTTQTPQTRQSWTINSILNFQGLGFVL